jgi:hypothetical protein
MHLGVRGVIGDQGHLFPIRDLECYIVTMVNPLSPHPLSPIAGTGSRLILAGAVLAVVWLTVIWALS